MSRWFDYAPCQICKKIVPESELKTVITNEKIYFLWGLLGSTNKDMMVCLICIKDGEVE